MLVAAVLVAAAAAPTSAASKALCFQVKDVSGDAHPGGDLGPDAAQTDSLDVLSADIATGPKNLVATLRLKTLTPEPYLVGGATYMFHFTLAGKAQTLWFKRTTSGAQAAGYEASTGGVGAPVSFAKDTGAGTITWTIPRKKVAGLSKGATFTGLKVQSYLGTNFVDGNGRGGTGFDGAVGAKPYSDGTQTCLKGT
jgi:hypothetical protein